MLILILEIIISVALLLYPITQVIRRGIRRKEKISGSIKWGSILSIIFGIYLWLKNGLTLDYGTAEEIIESKAEIMFYFGLSNIILGLLIILILAIGWISRKITKPLPNNS
ncbi:hypothetical protein [Adhaeribacter rhizoryzae]|uniref:Uncharacterized protein n=1 Tax=Adhaeribacter rhizoryzae TaxID=2607907 RepID=A0A5M6D8X0_9BACT|nr:hypothetical protein [Adhaeribacter rhizoryzae]KAA5543961.1 hypothetical protein F0145_15385 [Adhaeribacter rhizoryzae]